ncbi:MAG: helix-turn-helix domain-containing protein [Armatimonadetes bacterium]|nr:helix-turn-helix domain-containing protein [Armatimonadota bacterium]
MGEPASEVLTIEELAAYLKIPKSTLYKLARDGSVPCQKVGKHWRFHKSAIDEWLRERSRGEEGRSSGS